MMAAIVASAAYAALAKGTKAPDFTADTVDGKKLTLSDTIKANKVVVLDIWATWCGPCRAEIPHLVALQKKYASKGVTFVGLSVDAGKDEVAEFAKEYKINYPLPLDPRGQKIATKYKIQGVPTAFIIDRKGVIRSVHAGFAGKETVERLEKDINQILSEK